MNNTNSINDDNVEKANHVEVVLSVPTDIHERVCAAIQVADNMSVTDFLVWAADTEAQRVLSGNIIIVDDEKWEAFNAALDASTGNLEASSELMGRPSRITFE